MNPEIYFPRIRLATFRMGIPHVFGSRLCRRPAAARSIGKQASIVEEQSHEPYAAAGLRHSPGPKPILSAAVCATLGVSLFLSFAALAAESPATFKVSEFTFTRPAGWETVGTTSQMRKAQFKVTDASTSAKEPAEVIFYYFGPANGGGAQANVDRWFGQFKEPKDQIKAKTEETTVSSHKVTFVQAEGTYMSGMPGGPTTLKPNYGLAGAIIESSQGNVFVRMTGPRELVTKTLPAFKKMIESATTK